MHKLIDYICDELDELEKKAEKGKLSMSEVEYADKLAHLKKNLLRADELMDEGYSGDMGRGYYDGHSFARGRGSNAKRDSMGRYSRDNYSRYSRDGYSMDNREIVQELKNLMNEAPDDRTRNEFQQFITKMERM